MAKLGKLFRGETLFVAGVSISAISSAIWIGEVEALKSIVGTLSPYAAAATVVGGVMWLMGKK